MKKSGFLAILLCILILLCACTGRITAEEAKALALEKIRTEATTDYGKLYEDRITCEYEERDGTGYYMVEVPFQCSDNCGYTRKFCLRVHAETGEIERILMTK